nr:hypothetical protein [Cryptosporangium arvum]
MATSSKSPVTSASRLAKYQWSVGPDSPFSRAIALSESAAAPDPASGRSARR